MKTAICKKEETAQSKKKIKTLRLCIALFVAVFCCGILTAISAIMDYPIMKSSGHLWAFYFSLFLICGLLGVTLVYVYLLTHCFGYYRCKICGHVHRPADEIAAEAAINNKYGMLHCPVCDAVTEHKKLSRKDSPKIDTEN